MELAYGSSIYKGSESLMFAAPLATLPEVSFPDPKITPHTLYLWGMLSCNLPHPNFWVFHPFLKDF